MAYPKDITGLKFNNLLVVSFFDKAGKRRRYLCVCDCGNTHIARGDNLVSGQVKSCGCLLHNSPPNKTHGKRQHPTYGVWQNMKNRCYNKKTRAYEYYGGRGITVCKEWLTNFASFYEWLTKNKWEPGLEIDRKDNDKGYGPDNCRIVTRGVNLGNKGRYASNTTGYVGVKAYGHRFLANISINGKIKYLGIAETKRDAVILRNAYITENNINRKLQPVPD